MRSLLTAFALVVLAASHADAQASIANGNITATQQVCPGNNYPAGWNFGTDYDWGDHIGTNYAFTLMNTDTDNGYSVLIKVLCYDINGNQVDSTTSSVNIGPAAAMNNATLLPTSLKNDFTVPTDGNDYYDYYYYTHLSVTVDGGNDISDDEAEYFSYDG